MTTGTAPAGVSDIETPAVHVALARVARAQRAHRLARAERIAAMDAAFAAGASISAIGRAAEVSISVAWRTIRGRSNPAVRMPV